MSEEVIIVEKPVVNTKERMHEIAALPRITKKNKRFCELFNDFTQLETFGAGKASAMAAGYPEKYAANIAYQLLQKPQIQSYLTTLDDQIKSQTNITRQDYVRILMLNAAKCKGEATQARYWEMIGKAKGFIEPEDAQKNSIALFQVLDSKINQRLGIVNSQDIAPLEVQNTVNNGVAEPLIEGAKQ